MGHLRVIETFHAATTEGLLTFDEGTLVADSDPIVKGREVLFEAVEDAEARADDIAAARTTSRKKK